VRKSPAFAPEGTTTATVPLPPLRDAGTAITSPDLAPAGSWNRSTVVNSGAAAASDVAARASVAAFGDAGSSPAVAGASQASSLRVSTSTLPVSLLMPLLLLLLLLLLMLLLLGDAACES
jgi:hypothetical protein